MNQNVVVASISADNNGERFTKECLDDCARDLENREIEVTLDFDKSAVIGYAKDFHVTEIGLAVNMVLDDIWFSIAKAHNIDVFGVVGGIVRGDHNEGKTRVFDKFFLTQVSLTLHPADQTLPPIKLTEEPMNKKYSILAPVGTMILVDLIKPEVKDAKTETGLYLPDSQRAAPPTQFGTVVAVGDKVKVTLTVGDTVWFNANCYRAVNEKDERAIVDESNILAVVK